jgi:hypothetical protein
VTTETEVSTEKASIERREGDSTTQGEVTRSGASVTHQDADSKTRADADSKGLTVVHEDKSSVTRGELDEKGLRATREADCARDPANEICRESSAASVDEGGVRFGYKKTSVERVQRPSNRYTQFLLEAGGIYGDGDNFRMTGASAGLGLQGAVGSQLPGAKGGWFHGLGFRGLGHFSYVATESWSDFSDEVMSSSSNAYDVAGGAGYQMLKYGTLDPKDLTQTGFGLYLGYQAGLFGAAESDAQFSHGPNIVISRPKYNAGTASTSSLFLSGIVLPLDNLFIAAVSLGYAGFGGGAARIAQKKEREACREHSECGGELICSGGVCSGPEASTAAGVTSAPAEPPSHLPPAELPALDF